MNERDLYSILGVLPDAEEVVIKAAYRALAQRYHPDKWKGNAAEAHQRMVLLNQAYAVLSDPSKRSAYDATRKPSNRAQFEPDDEEDRGQAFDSALGELEERWNTACAIFPDLVEHRARLAKISTTLAFAYVTTLLDSKLFTHRGAMASHVEQVFLERYFGINPKILDYGRSLIFAGHKAAAKALNNLVDVMGSNVDADLMIGRIDKQFGFDVIRQREINRLNEVERESERESEREFEEWKNNFFYWIFIFLVVTAVFIIRAV